MHPRQYLNGRIGIAGAIAALGLLVGLGGVSWAPAARAQGSPQSTGDAQRGKAYFLTYKCYACHGYSGQTGLRRLVPMRFPQEAFIAFVQGSPIPDMPAYKDVPRATLIDLYAFISSIPADAPDVATIPLLSEIRARASAKH